MRIISIVPSQTELLHSLGLDEEVVGITRFCVHPEGLKKTKTIVGGTKKLDLQKIRTLNPDLIIANKEENERTQVETLMKEFNVWVSDVHDLNSACDMIYKIGSLCQRECNAEKMVHTIRDNFNKIKPIPVPKTVAYLIWEKPMMIAGKGTFIDDMLMRLNLQNVADSSRYPGVTSDSLRKKAPEVVLLSSEPFPYREKHLLKYKELLPGSHIELVDGEMFSWYGSRMLLSPSYFNALLRNFSK